MPVTISQLRATIGMDAREFDQGIKEVNAALTKMGGDATVAGKKLADALSNASTQAGRSLDKLGSKLSSVGKGLSLGVTAPLLLLGKASVDIAATFEQNMNVLQAASGATGEQMAQLSKLSKDLGADLELPGTSAGDAAKALLELTKGGLSVKDAMDAARPTLQLSAAAQVDNARAAEIVSDSLNQFSLAGNQAARVADLLAGAQIAAGGGIDKMAIALRQASSAFSTMGLNINEAVTAVSLMAKAGHKGEEGGTALKTALIQLSTPTSHASKLMKQLGFDLFDAHNQTKPFRDIVVDLHDKVGTLTERQRAQVTATLGGAHAFQALTVLAKAGGKGFDEMAAKVSKQGTAAKLAGAQNKGLAGAIDAMKSAFQTAAQAGIEPIIGDLTRLAKSVGELVNKFSELPQGTRRFIVGILAGAAALGPLLIGLGNVVKAVGTLKVALAAARAGEGIAAWLASGPVIASIAAIVGAITFLAVAWESNWGHVQQFTAAVWNTIVDIFNEGAASIKDIVTGIAEVMGGNFVEGSKKLAAAGENIGRTFVANYVNELGKLGTEQQAALDKAAKAAKTAAAAAAKDAARVPGITVPGLNLDAKESEGAKQLKRFKAELLETTIKLTSAKRGESKAQQDLLAEYPLMNKAQRDDLIAKRDTLDALNRQMEAQKNFREELAKVNATIRALKDGTSLTLGELQKQFPGVNRAQLLFLANQKEVQKGLEIQKQKATAVADALRGARSAWLENASNNTVAASAVHLFGEELIKLHPELQTAEQVLALLDPKQKQAAENFAEIARKAKIDNQVKAATNSLDALSKTFNLTNYVSRESRVAFELYSESLVKGVNPMEQLDDAQVKVVRSTIKLRDAQAISDRTTQHWDEQTQRLLETQADVPFALSDIQTTLGLMTHGTRDAIFAWETLHVLLGDLPTDIQPVIAQIRKTTEAVESLKAIKEGFASIFTDAFKNVNKGFSGFFKSIMNGVDDLLRQLAAKFLAAQAVKLLFSLVPGGMNFLAGLDAAGNIGGARAKGGPVNSSSAYLVGENGPEMFVPSRSGRIVPNGQMAAAGGGNTIVNVTVNATDIGSFKRSESEIRSSAYRIGEAAKKRNLG